MSAIPEAFAKLRTLVKTDAWSVAEILKQVDVCEVLASPHVEPFPLPERVGDSQPGWPASGERWGR